VTTLLVSAAVSLVVALLGTPVAIRVFSRHGYASPSARRARPATPTSGHAHDGRHRHDHRDARRVLRRAPGHRRVGLGVRPAVLFLMTGLGAVGFADDFIKLYKQRSLGLRSGPSSPGRWWSRRVRGAGPALPRRVRPHPRLHAPVVPGRLRHLDRAHLLRGPGRGMVAGTPRGEPHRRAGRAGHRRGILVLAAYVIIGNWQLRNDCTLSLAPNCYDVRDPLDLAVVAAALMAACVGFLWWNAPPARIFMGDTGSLALAVRWPAWPSPPGPSCCWACWAACS